MLRPSVDEADGRRTVACVCWFGRAAASVVSVTRVISSFLFYRSYTLFSQQTLFDQSQHSRQLSYIYIYTYRAVAASAVVAACCYCLYCWWGPFHFHPFHLKRSIRRVILNQQRTTHKHTCTRAGHKRGIYVNKVVVSLSLLYGSSRPSFVSIIFFLFLSPSSIVPSLVGSVSFRLVPFRPVRPLVWPTECVLCIYIYLHFNLVGYITL